MTAINSRQKADGKAAWQRPHIGNAGVAAKIMKNISILKVWDNISRRGSGGAEQNKEKNVTAREDGMRRRKKNRWDGISGE